MDHDGLHSDVDAVRNRHCEVKALTLSIDFIPLMLLGIDADSTALGSITPIPLEIQVIDWNVVNGAIAGLGYWSVCRRKKKSWNLTNLEKDKKKQENNSQFSG